MKSRTVILFLILSLFLTCPCFSRPLKIAFITDTHYGPSLNTSYIERCIDDMNSLDSIDFVLIGGDVSESGTNEQIAGAKSAFDRLRHPYWVVSGNHDSKWSESGCTAFRDTFGYEYFEFEAGGYRFLGCNSGPNMRMAPALISFDNMEWLRGLKKGKPVIFINHFPLSYEISNWFEVREELLRLDCRLTIGGHVHKNKVWDCYGLPGITCTASKGKADYTAYNIVTIRNGEIQVAERQIHQDQSITLAPWFTTQLQPVQESLKYDNDGLPENYKLFTYKDNAKFPQVKALWKMSENTGIACGFALRDSTAWYATDSGKVVALSVATGNILWSRQFEGRIYSTPTESDGILVFGCTDGAIYGLSATDGRTFWKYSTGSAIVACPAIRDGRIYIGSSEGVFRCLELKEGRLLWECAGIEGYCDAAPCIDGRQVVFGTWGGRMYSINTADGRVNWTWETTSPGACSPVITQGRIFIACPDRHTYCLDAKTGKPLFLVDDGRESIGLSEDGKRLFVKSMFGKALAFNTQIPARKIKGTYAPDSHSNGLWQPDIPVLEPSQTLWYVKSGVGRDFGSSALAVCSNLLLIPSHNGAIHALDASTGAQKWIHKVGLGLVNPISAWKKDSKTYILASTTDGKITLLEVSE